MTPSRIRQAAGTAAILSRGRIGQVLWVLLPVAAAELGIRLLWPRETVPAPAEVAAGEYFDPAQIDRGAGFARPQLRLGLLKEGLQLAVLAALAARASRRPARKTAAPPAAHGALEAVRLMGLLTAVSLPVSALQRRRAIAVGLDTQSWRGWWGDLGKASAIGAVLTAGAGASVTALIARYPRRWWALAAVGSVGVGGVIGTLAPVLLDPIFNDFTPLPDGETRRAVLELARAAGVEVGEVYSVDASRRTSGANAYVTGLGPTKRVVLFDTLLDRYSPEEVGVVVAHELAHVRHRDVMRALAFSALVAPAAGLAVQRLTGALLPPAPRRRRRVRAAPEVLPALALAASLVTGPVGMLSGRLSRAIERRCDAESLELSDAPDAFISFQRAIAVQNVGDVDPPRWVRTLLASHPPTLERIGAAVAYRERGPSRSASAGTGANGGTSAG
jgi:STE24 endopeptidase